MFTEENMDSVKKEFIDELKMSLLDHLPVDISENATLEIREVLKGNDQKLTGLIIGEPDINIRPTIYIDRCIEEYRHGEPIDEILQKIADQYVEIRDPDMRDFDIDKITIFDEIKDRLATKVVNTEMSKEYLSEVPYKEFGDLAVICQIRFKEIDGSLASTTVNDHFLDKWGVSFDEVLDIALKNDHELTKPQLAPMDKIMMCLMLGEDYHQEGFLPEPTESDVKMYVLSTADKVNGAKLLNQQEILDEIASFTNSNLIILPSSIHEVIVVPENEQLPYNVTELNQMITEINNNEVRPDEVLSDHAYHYSKDERMLTYEKDGKTVKMQFSEKDKVEVPKKEGIKAKLKEGEKKAKALNETARDTRKKTKEACL